MQSLLDFDRLKKEADSLLKWVTDPELLDRMDPAHFKYGPTKDKETVRQAKKNAGFGPTDEPGASGTKPKQGTATRQDTSSSSSTPGYAHYEAHQRHGRSAADTAEHSYAATPTGPAASRKRPEPSPSRKRQEQNRPAPKPLKDPELAKELAKLANQSANKSDDEDEYVDVEELEEEAEEVAAGGLDRLHSFLGTHSKFVRIEEEADEREEAIAAMSETEWRKYCAGKIFLFIYYLRNLLKTAVPFRHADVSFHLQAFSIRQGQPRSRWLTNNAGRLNPLV